MGKIMGILETELKKLARLKGLPDMPGLFLQKPSERGFNHPVNVPSKSTTDVVEEMSWNKWQNR